MNTTTKILASTVIALASAMAGNAFAQSTDHMYPEMSATSSTVTRAQVQSELAQSKQNGMGFTQASDHSYPAVAYMNNGAGKSRAEVQSELRMQSKNGVNGTYDHS